MVNQPEKRFFQSKNFRYVVDKHGFVPDCVYIYQLKKVYQVIFDQNEGWVKSVTRAVKKYECDLVLGFVKGDNKKFRIYQDNEMIDWERRNIDFKDVIL